MLRSALVMTVLASTPAWAVGERIALSKGPEFMQQLHETLCISMECGPGVDATISAKVVKGKAEIKVLASGGAVKATITAPLNDAGRISSMDLVAATSGIIQAIEGNLPKAKPDEAADPTSAKKKALAAKAKKKSSLKLASKGRAAHPPG